MQFKLMAKTAVFSLFSLAGLCSFFGRKEMPKHQFESKVQSNTLDHSAWNALLKKYVDLSGDVDYKNFKNEQQSLTAYLDHLANNAPSDNWTKEEGLAYYINLYNAATVQLILNHYPTKSIKDIKRPWSNDWVKIGEKTYSLGDIEHKILRKMDEPRIHFAINCASFSCPKLLNEAYTASQLERQLQKVSEDFVNDPTRNIISKEKLQLSNIFKWYKSDFTTHGNLIEYIRPYSKIDIDAKADIEYLTYDWSLNEKK
ncbi:DUF547 domain-containing protein [Zobellia galactanivorans]|uniref:DUF547 domain-containing protein n=1 Tax=Zobellia TaxID=112040 RepID=UPI000B52BBB3|nr:MULTISPECIES: DUF547 domain-containing protein [Zobellia]MBU3028259.1 DUF547 domain-containing protein [Zobellia galactanivorans]MDO6808541.1 DUF547 domain-containing protein [Zobellia galactanivorans]OWW26320.1 hypothetical protein B4Q04_01165 [Zobellia sp. OII3]